MSDDDAKFLIGPVSSKDAISFCNGQFSRKDLKFNSKSAYLFIRHISSSLPISYTAAIKEFSDHCFIENNENNESSFVLAADSTKFYRILSQISDFSCSALVADIHSQLEDTKKQHFKIRNKSFHCEKATIMGILNITPDSFYDGGKHYQLSDYSGLAGRMIENGADIIDIGGESTRPGSKSVSIDDELKRVLPAIEQIRAKFDIPISIDTTKPEVADIALNAGADMVNDTSGLAAGEKMLDVLAAHEASYCLMHIQGTPENMQQHPQYNNVLMDVYRYFREKLQLLEQAGLPKEKVCIDPGIGFGKTLEHNITLQKYLGVFQNLGYSLLLGTSNKSFIGAVLDCEKNERLVGSLVTQVVGFSEGASIFRVHNIAETKDALKMAGAFY